MYCISVLSQMLVEVADKTLLHAPQDGKEVSCARFVHVCDLRGS